MSRTTGPIEASPDEHVERYSPPAYLSDFNDTLLDEWSHAVSVWFDEAIAKQAPVLDGQRCQFYNQLKPDPPAGPRLRQEIVWNAFPANQLRRWGRAYALIAADHLLALDQHYVAPRPLWPAGQWSDLFYRPQDEYCEWRVERDTEGRIKRVVFTSEPPEYWQALCGDDLTADGGTPVAFTGDRDRLVDLYREHVSPEVKLQDLLCTTDVGGRGTNDPTYKAGQYNPYNKWNTTHGLMHLSHPSNSLQAEITLGADATVLWSFEGRVVADSDTLIARAGFGGANRCSDPTIGASVNHLAAAGYGVTLADPVGLYMDHLDMTGWTIGDGNEPVDSDWFQVVRGRPGMIERAVFEVPSKYGTVSDIRIAGEPIQYGGQLAERMTVKLIGLAAVGANFSNAPARLPFDAYVEPANPAMVNAVQHGDRLPDGAIPVFDYAESVTGTRAVNPPGRDGAPAHPPVSRRAYWSRAL